MPLTHVMTGFMELTPRQQLEFNRMKSIIAEEYARFGFTAIDTPVLERAEVLLAKAGGETEKQIYRFLKGDTDIALRFDLTVPLARYVAEHYNDLVFPFRRSHIGKVYRGERAQHGRFREFYQCDIDVIGDGTLAIAYDAELPRIIYAIFSRLNLGDFTIKVNNRHILSGFMAHIGAEPQAAAILRVVDKIEKISHEAFVEELAKLGLIASQVDQVVRFVDIHGSPDEMIAALRAMNISGEAFVRGVNELEKVVNLVRVNGVPDANFAVDLSIARGLDYYTGTVYETFLNKYRQLGSICSGGRYDNLASQYTNHSLPGVGVSIGLTRLFSQLMELGLVESTRKTVADTVVIPLSNEQLDAALAAADYLRAQNLRVDVLLESGPVKKKFKYADKLGVTKVVIIGADEVAKGAYTVQDMRSGERVACTQDGLAVALAETSKET